MMSASCKVILENRLDELQRFITTLTEFARVGSLPEEIAFSVQLAIDELFTNIVSYGYDDDESHQIEIKMSIQGRELRIDLIDDAKQFDPLHEAAQPDLDASLEDRRIGGVGIHLVKTMMDDVSYKYEDSKNHLTLVKKF
ncbi:MAG: ATP-binding protein [Gammaproteobacteria bacterium]|nr:ATP-binding protein [Gammaproteobacteria bacterium]